MVYPGPWEAQPGIICSHRMGLRENGEWGRRLLCVPGAKPPIFKNRETTGSTWRIPGRKPHPGNQPIEHPPQSQLFLCQLSRGNGQPVAPRYRKMKRSQAGRMNRPYIWCRWRSSSPCPGKAKETKPGAQWTAQGVLPTSTGQAS